LITSGIGLYPQGIEIGTVKSVSFNKDTQLKTIEVEPAVDFNSLKKVMVLL
ncbi:MAG: rod shape-determining protein MreC, partial [Firmicutes bacterium]|nr:rod shape-determining protein MreC [Bacillota bacterium]